jgi:hypothetical protein
MEIDVQIILLLKCGTWILNLYNFFQIFHNSGTSPQHAQEILS